METSALVCFDQELEGKTSAARQSLITRGRQKVTDALGALADATLAASRAAAAAGCGSAAAVSMRTQATADAAMQELLVGIMPQLCAT
jgi:hypothetical protein